MIIKTELLRVPCSKILAAVDTSEQSVLTETLQLKTDGNFLVMSVTNREYHVQVKIDIGNHVDFNASVNAKLFLKLIANITTDDIELDVQNTSLVVKGNGTYKLPLIYQGGVLLEVPTIDLTNITSTMNIKTNILDSIYTYNSKELSKGTAKMQAVQKMYYVDNTGAITFVNGACVNNFTLAQPVKMLLNSTIVKLFKLFKEDEVSFKMANDAISADIIQTKVQFADSTTTLTAILSCDSALINSVPVTAIRNTAMNTYPYSVSLGKDAVLQTINRLLLFSTNTIKAYSTFEFNANSVKIYDDRKENCEELSYNNSTSGITSTYTAILDLNDLKLALEGCTDNYFTLNFGDTRAVVVARNNLYNVIPEVTRV